MSTAINQAGLYWQPLGGNNIDQISGHCYRYTDLQPNKEGNLRRTTIIVDLGKFDNHQALGVQNSTAAVPDIRNLLVGEYDTAKAIFLTHSHPDHLNGIIHYLKAGYHLPDLYAGKYTFMILEDLYKFYQIPKTQRPAQITVAPGDKIKIGSLEIGKKADAIVIDRDVFNTPSLEISDIKVIRTVFDGKIVYERA